ncbi:MAG: hypothetical protein NTY66_02445 [Candidatus Vogelbacteria bacterium]|nr:hypothetical protein [Candidatus Vogelbacteria bacterium]
MQANFFNIEYYFYQIYLFFQKIGFVEQVDGRVVFAGYWYIFALKMILILISVFLTFLFIDFLYRLILIRREEQEQLMSAISANMEKTGKKNARWEEVERLISSDNESDLKLAVIEADKMLEDLLSTLGYAGESIGDRLMNVGKGDMESLDDAWEAHKYRNRIAHEVDFKISQHEAKQVIALYGRVFREYQYI